MSITKKELDEIIRVKPSVEKIATLSSDGKNLLMRLPKEVREFLGLVKGDKLKFLVDENGKIALEILEKNDNEKEKNN